VSRLTSWMRHLFVFNLRGYHPLRLAFPSHSNRSIKLYTSQALSLSLATTWEISVDFFSYRYLDVSVPYVRFYEPMYSVHDDRISSIGFPHSDILGSMLVASSPGLFAGCHVFRRLLLPRHSPCALNFLTI
jgi:hypothetical protein